MRGVRTREVCGKSAVVRAQPVPRASIGAVVGGFRLCWRKQLRSGALVTFICISGSDGFAFTSGFYGGL